MNIGLGQINANVSLYLLDLQFINDGYHKLFPLVHQYKDISFTYMQSCNC